MNRSSNPTRGPSARRWIVSASTLLAATISIAQNAPTPPATNNDTKADEEEVVELSPFVVSTTSKGYFAENTLAGSRLNTNVSDLASSITVVTTQQMEDTASVDVNDVFRYEANTEGSLTYTPSVNSLRNDGIVDVNAGFTQGGSGSPQTNATANRVRGLGVPSTAINYYPSISNVPFDVYNVQSVEINRGPNSMLFGVGSPAGIVNQSTAQAVLNKNSVKLQLRTDNQGSARSSISINKGIIEDKLAIYLAAVYDDKQFERKPSYDLTNRQYAAITYKPFQTTTIRASFENYNNHNRRPNTLAPRDFVTQWRLAGRPVYDPSTLKVTKLDTGEVIGPFVMQKGSPLLNQTRAYIESRSDYDPTKWNSDKTAYNGVNIYGEAAISNAASVLYVPGINFVNNSRPIWQIADGQLQNLFSPIAGQYRQVYGTSSNPAANAALYPTEANIFANAASTLAYSERYTSSAAWTQTGGLIGNYQYPSVTDKSIYDWSDVNLLQMNFGHDKNKTYNVEVEQKIMDDLYLNLGFFRQDFKSITNYTVSQLNATTLFVDTNVTLPDGRPNPYLGQVFVEDFDPDQFINTDKEDHYRAMLAYTPDFRKNDGWLKFLGHHQAVAYASRQESKKTLIRRRWFFTGGDEVANGTIRWLKNPNDNANGTPTGWNYENTSAHRLYYLSSPGSDYGTVTRSSGEWNTGSYTGPYETYNFDSNTWEGVDMTQEWVDHSASTGAQQRRLDSISLGATSYFWDDRLITTLGWRRDNVRNRATTTGTITDENGNIISAAMTNAEKWVDGYFQTDTVLHRYDHWFKQSGNTSTLGAVLKPFTGWDSIEQKANEGSMWYQFLRDFGVSYNKSDNFNPPSSPLVDVFGTPLPIASGHGKDYGFQFTLLDRKLFARINWFKATNEDENIPTGTAISRLTSNFDTTLFRNWARTIALINMGHDPTSSDFATVSSADEPAVQAATEAIWGQDYNYYTNVGSIGATQTSHVNGMEAQVTYNPTPNFRIKFTAGKQDTVYTNVIPEYDAWYQHRLPLWQNAKAADYLLPQYQQYATYTASNGTPVDLTTFTGSYGYNSAATLADAFGNYNAQLYYNNVVFPQYAFIHDLEGKSAPGQRRYSASVVASYDFDEGTLRGWGVGAAQRWADKAVIGYYGKESGLNPTPGYLDVADTNRPIYDSDQWHTDLWVSYTTKIWGDVGMKVQLNINDVFEDGGLRPIAANYDGSIANYRIVDSRQFILSATFDF